MTESELEAMHWCCHTALRCMASGSALIHDQSCTGPTIAG